VDCSFRLDERTRGIEGNDLVDRIAKEAAVEDGPVVYDKIPKEVIVTREKDYGLQMWEQQWMDTRKGAVTKAFFPISEKEANTENTDISRVNNFANRTWLHKIILIQTRTNRKPDVPL